MANIANTDALLAAITDIETPAELPQGTVASKMDAAEINQVMQGIESAFNRLYEKLRLLEDLHDFSREYISSEFRKTSEAFTEVVSTIDKTVDSYVNDTAMASSAGFESGHVITDRDGSPVETASLLNGTILVPARHTVETAEPSSASVVSAYTPYRRILTPASNYESFHINEQPTAAPLTEEVSFLLPKPKKVNFIDVSAFGAKVEGVRLLLENGDTVPISTGSHMFPRYLIHGITMTLRSIQTKPEDIEVTDQRCGNDSAEMEQDITDVKDTIFETMIASNGSTTFLS